MRYLKEFSLCNLKQNIEQLGVFNLKYKIQKCVKGILIMKLKRKT
jgi:hypothetical protein